MDEIHQVLFYPFIENLVVTIGYFGALPFIEGFKHQHHTHFIASSYQLRCRHVVRGTDGIYAHILHDTDLATDGCIVHGCTKWTKVVVIANTLKFGELSIEEETLFWNDFEGTDTETGGIFIYQSMAGINLGICSIEERIFYTPQSGSSYGKLLFELTSVVSAQFVFFLSYYFTCWILYFGHNTVSTSVCILWSNQLGIQNHLGVFLSHHRSGHISSPSRYMGIFRYHQVNIAIKTGTRIPAGRFVFIFQTDSELIDFASFYVRSDIEMERVISIRPISGFLTIDIHMGMAHGSIENQCSFLSFRE